MHRTTWPSRIFALVAATMVIVTAAKGFVLLGMVRSVEVLGAGHVQLELNDNLPVAETLRDIALLCWTLSGFLFVVEMGRAHVEIVNRHPEMQRYSLTVVALALPIANLYWPWKGFGEIHRNIRSSERAGATQGATILLAILYFGTAAVERLIDYMAGKVPETFATVEAFSGAFEPIALATFALTILALASATLAFLFLNTVSVALRDGPINRTAANRPD